MFKKTFAVAGSLAAAVLAFSPLAQAGSVSSLTFSLTGWNASTPGSNSSSPNQQANASNPIMTAGNLFVMGTMTGLPNWCVSGKGCNGGPNTFSNFISNGGNGGTNWVGAPWTSGGGLSTTLSTSNYQSASLLELTFSISNTWGGSITHDDGMSIYNSAGTCVVCRPNPTIAETTTFSNLAAGTYHLYYVEANGAPSQLTFNSITEAPEPGALALFGAGLLGCALFIGRRRRMSRSI